MARSFEGKTLSGQSSIFKSNDKRLALKRITEANVAAANALFTAAIDVFVSTAVKSMVVDTGMSVAGFEALATFLGVSSQKVKGLATVKLNGTRDVQSAIASKRVASRPSYTSITGQSINSPRTAARGSLLGGKAFKIQYANATSGIASFEFDAVIWQLAHNIDIGKETLEPASTAMETFLVNNLANFMDPARILRSALNI